ncbi:MAG: hypothetical protein JST23_02130 [Bacteroidetes bacterium]|nr:hypothetical protein [Bacteroidota bacterium]
MTFLQALYGSQYYEIQQRGKDGNKGRINGNIFLAVFVFLVLIIALLLCVKFIPGFNDDLSNQIKKTFGYRSSKSIVKYIVVALVAVVYLIFSVTIGNKTNFQKHTEAFMALPDEVKKKATVKLLVPFFILLGAIVVLAISSIA